jgi:hypothetical protein
MRKYLPHVGIGLAAVLLVGLAVWLCIPTQKVLRVASTQWQYDVELQQRTIQHAEEWGRPWNREVAKISCTRRFYGMERCMCHETCNGTGSSRSCRQSCSTCPEFRDWCSYDYVTWPTVKQWVTAGDWLPVKWPETPALTPDQRLVQYEKYTVSFVDQGESYSYEAPNLTTFKKLRKGAAWSVNLYRTGSASPVFAE